MKNRITPNNITVLKANEIFVFGSNSAGHHAGGAARLAHQKFGAIWGEGHGLFGQSFAIDTMSGLDRLTKCIELFIIAAKRDYHSKSIFLVTELGCGIAGYTPEQIAPLLKDAANISNIHLPESFWKILTPEKYWENEIVKCKKSPYYFMTKYMKVNNEPFTTAMNEEDFNEFYNELWSGKYNLIGKGRIK